MRGMEGEGMQTGYEDKLWGGRFQGEVAPDMAQFHNIAGRTAWLLEADIQGSIAHADMLTHAGLITPQQGEAIDAGLRAMLQEAQAGTLQPDDSYEDVQTYVEVKLRERIGEAAKVLHTARSRNDQVNTGLKLYARARCQQLAQAVQQLMDSIENKAQQHPVPMPGYTHLQRAQVITFKHWLMAYHAMLARDLRRVNETVQGMDECPLGCGALAGTTHAIDRAYSARLLGFDRPYTNFLDGVGDRDYVLEALAAMSILMMHLSRLCEELVIFSSHEFGFVLLDDRYATGSSIMPQKKNPDSVELIRGKTGRVYGHLMTLLTVMKGLPLAYNKDMQEDKNSFYDAMNTTLSCLTVMNGVISTMMVREERLRCTLQKGFMNATEAADYLVRRGVPFRDAHGIVGQAVLYAEQRQKPLEALTLDEWQQFFPAIDQTIYDNIDYDKTLHLGIKKEML
jgi:argininosuccinate lyase